MILLTGGARSGKSMAAASLLEGRDEPVTYIATGVALDDEMVERIQRHRRERPSAWRVVEEATDLMGAIEDAGEPNTLIIDCLTLWVSNLVEEHADEAILDRSERASQLAAQRAAPTIVVTNEVGSGVVPVSHVGRRFRDLQGRVNQMWAARADQAYLVVAGRLLELSRADEPTL